MYIKKVNIKNFKIFEDFSIPLNEGINILAGDNEAGKSTILEAINLALTGLLNGKYLKNELSPYLFNKEVIDKYIKDLQSEKPSDLPNIIIEIFLAGNDIDARLRGCNNTEKEDAYGLYYKIEFDEQYKDDYEDFIKSNRSISTIPIEYYKSTWNSFAYGSVTPRSIPIKSALIDSSSSRYQNGSDIYISRIIHDLLDSKEIVDISQAHRKIKELFMEETAIKTINEKINKTANISDVSDKTITLSVDFSSRNAWENSLLTYLDEIPFHQIGKGEQCIIKTRLALENKKSKEANIILLEEPENHLSHTKLNQLISNIKSNYANKQVVISTHSSFVANKLGLENLFLLNDNKMIHFKDLLLETQNFFKKIPGYDTLRLILCKKAILVEGDSDELVIQKAYMIKNNGKLPIEDGIDVISVGTSFLRFLEIAEKLGKSVVVATDNDGDVEALKKKYNKYVVESAPTKDFIKVYFDEEVDDGELIISGKKFNYNTLEPKLLKVNSLKLFNKLFGTNYSKIDELHKYMRSNKTECALKIFDTTENIVFPAYILKVIQNYE